MSALIDVSHFVPASEMIKKIEERDCEMKVERSAKFIEERNAQSAAIANHSKVFDARLSAAVDGAMNLIKVRVNPPITFDLDLDNEPSIDRGLEGRYRGNYKCFLPNLEGTHVRSKYDNLVASLDDLGYDLRVQDVNDSVFGYRARLTLSIKKPPPVPLMTMEHLSAWAKIILLILLVLLTIFVPHFGQLAMVAGGASLVFFLIASIIAVFWAG